VGQTARPLARSDLQDLLVTATGPGRIRFASRCEAVGGDDSSAQVRFADGSTFAADLVVAADGTHSIIRSWVAGAPVEHRYVGYVNFNTIADVGDLVPADSWLTWVGQGKRAAFMPVGAGRHYVWFDVPLPAGEAIPPDGISPKEELEKAFTGWAQPVRALIDRALPDRINRVQIRDLPPVPTWHRNRVVLLGDAVHAMAPDLGQGGCQVLEDAVVLSHYLTTTNVSVSDALARYEAERRPRTDEIVRRARKRAEITHGSGPATADWYQELAGETGEKVIAGLIESVLTGPCR
jgi:FAD-dependent urate hydroxylase